MPCIYYTYTSKRACIIILQAHERKVKKNLKKRIDDDIPFTINIQLKKNSMKRNTSAHAQIIIFYTEGL